MPTRNPHRIWAAALGLIVMLAAAAPLAQTALQQRVSGTARLGLSTSALKTVAPVPSDRQLVHMLLYPLVDDSEPSRWQTLGVDWVCAGGGDVTLDGHPLVNGAELPPTPFELRWTLHRCPLLEGTGLLAEGTVRLVVQRLDDSRSVVLDSHLRWFDATGRQEISESALRAGRNLSASRS